MVLRCWKEFSRPGEQGAFFGIAAKEQGAFSIMQGGAAYKLRMVGRVLARAGKAGLNAGPRFAEITPGSEFCNQQIVTAAEERG